MYLFSFAFLYRPTDSDIIIIRKRLLNSLHCRKLPAELIKFEAVAMAFTRDYPNDKTS